MNGRGDPDLVSVAGDSENWLVVWDESGDSGEEIHGARVSPSGSVLDTSGILVCGTAGDHYDEQVASGDSGYLVVWTDDRFRYERIFAGRVTRSGAVLDSAGIQVTLDSADCDYAHVAFGGSGYLVVWQSHMPHSPYEICGARLDPNGAVLDSEPILIASRDYDCASPSVAFDGTDYIVAWQVESEEHQWRPGQPLGHRARHVLGLSARDGAGRVLSCLWPGTAGPGAVFRRR